jgi:hypothetical protein
MQSALYRRYQGGSDEPITARTNLCIYLCVQEFDTSHLPDQVQDQVARLATSSQGARRIAGPLTEGPGPTSHPGSLPAPRVACHCSPAGFGRQQHKIHLCSIHICNFRLRVYSFLLVFFDSLAGQSLLGDVNRVVLG